MLSFNLRYSLIERIFSPLAFSSVKGEGKFVYFPSMELDLLLVTLTRAITQLELFTLLPSTEATV